ncbi:techylectin-5A-like [Amphibalanus amphitrite]|uniref:techylectin-5A-like n=1 Tax=Amphibalanus amphitrite TaxID=1232801 RepID=UPI001C91C443|nr:techylectin-5A-like [Amphibalanus amphitrite]
MAAWRHCTVVLWSLIGFCAIIGAEQQQQQAVLPSTIADQVLNIVTQAVHNEMRSIVSNVMSRMEALERRLVSHVESLGSRLTLLGSRMDELAPISVQDTQSLRTEELPSRLDSHKAQLDNMTAQRSEHGLQEDENSASVGGLILRIDTLATQLETQRSQLTELATNHQTELADLKSQIDRAVECSNSQRNETSQISEADVRPRDCSDLPNGSTTGVYLVYPDVADPSQSVRALCDMDTDGGGWTVIQRRDDITPREDFYRTWRHYKRGFGNLTGEFWWGLHHVWQLTSVRDRRYLLRVDLQAFDGDRAHAVYQDFNISSESDGYRLAASGYSGNAGNSLRNNINRQFSTHDRDNDGWLGNSCAQRHQGAWWYYVCGFSNLNGQYLGSDGGSNMSGIWWGAWKKYESLKKTELKIRPF